MKTAQIQSVRNIFFRACAGLRHVLSAWNTGGEGVHSPYLFEWVRMVMYDSHPYYIWKDIEALRSELLSDTRIILFEDCGSGSQVRGERSFRSVSSIAQSALESKCQAELLFRMVNWLGHQRHSNGLEIVELGTSLGITSAYLAAPHSANRVTTFEGCSAVAQIARRGWEKLGLTNIRCVEGNIDHTLPIYAREGKGIVDVVFIDANHTREATLRYVHTFLPMMGEKSVMILDDIHHNREMEEAWHMVQKMDGVSSTMDIFHTGWVFFDPHYLKKHYCMRI